MCVMSSTRKGCWENETLFRVSAGSYLRPQIRLTGNPKLYNSMGIPWETLNKKMFKEPVSTIPFAFWAGE